MLSWRRWLLLVVIGWKPILGKLRRGHRDLPFDTRPQSAMPVWVRLVSGRPASPSTISQDGQAQEGWEKRDIAVSIRTSRPA